MRQLRALQGAEATRGQMPQRQSKSPGLLDQLTIVHGRGLVGLSLTISAFHSSDECIDDNLTCLALKSTYVIHIVEHMSNDLMGASASRRKLVHG